jgi:peptidoglycan/LPS O-acetylase OafA/YrhL
MVEASMAGSTTRERSVESRALPTSVGTADSHVISYRPDLDGLRAIAVWSVVVYHLSTTAVPGGYLGVDMFFVLSGFLITSIVWRETGRNIFSIIRFYDRRIRRIMPALIVLLVASTLVSALILLPTDLVGYGKSLLATLGFVANIYFWRDTNYFSPAATTKPLLHLWSLGVEEQFYILLPPLLMLLARTWRAAALPAVILLTLLSLAANILLTRAGGASPAFFLLPTRGWELGIGAILALLPPNFVLRGMLAHGAAYLGSALIVLGLATAIDVGILPVALPVTVGTALLVLSGSQLPPVPNRVLQFAPLVWSGLISYSLYLWHWPIIVLGQYWLVRDFNTFEAAAAVILMLGLATASWWFVERPYRSKSMPIFKVRRNAAIFVAALAACAVLLIGSHGLPSRLGAEAAAVNEAVDTNYRCPVFDYLPFGASRACAMNLPSRDPADAQVVLLGNSHAQMYAPLWTAILSSRGETGLLVPLNSCLPTVSANISGDCIDSANQNLTAVAGLGRVHTVILGLTWDDTGMVDRTGKTLDNAGHKALIAALDDLITRLERNGKRVVLIGPIAEPGWDLASTLSRQLAFGRAPSGPTSEPAAQFVRAFGPAIDHFAARKDVGFARVDLVQCRAARCNFMAGGRSLFADSNHLAAGALPLFRDTLEAALPNGR